MDALAKKTFRYADLDRDLRALDPAECACVLAGLLNEHLDTLRISAESQVPWHDEMVGVVARAADCYMRLTDTLDCSGAAETLYEVHSDTGRKITYAGRSFGSYCRAAATIGHEHFSALLRAADIDKYHNWLVRDGCKASAFPKISPVVAAQQWPEICAAIAALSDLDCDDLHLGIRNEHIEVAKSSPEVDGPCGIFQWRHDGIVTDQRMQEQTWRLAKYLWENLDREVALGTLIGARSVFTDDLTSDQSIQRQGSNATNWFRDRGIPLKVSVSTTRRYARMQRN